MKLPTLPDLQSMKPRERLLVISSGIVLLILVLDRAVLHPWLREGRLVKEEIRSMERSLQHHRQLLSRKDYVLGQLGSYQQYLRPPMADELQMAALLKEIEGVIAETPVILGEIKPLAVETDPLMNRYSLDVQLECTLEEWVDLVVRLESSPSLFQVIRAGLSIQEDVSDRLKGTLRVVSTAMRVEQPDFLDETEGSDATAVQ